MTNERAMELLNGVVDYLGLGENTQGHIEVLINAGFTPDELVENFNFSRKDIDDFFLYYVMEI